MYVLHTRNSHWIHLRNWISCVVLNDKQIAMGLISSDGYESVNKSVSISAICLVLFVQCEKMPASIRIYMNWEMECGKGNDECVSVIGTGIWNSGIMSIRHFIPQHQNNDAGKGASILFWDLQLFSLWNAHQEIKKTF